LKPRLRELIQQLGEAIHESVIESDQIAGVVQNIRQHGFDVLMMLEATIALNESDSSESKVTSDGGEHSREDGLRRRRAHAYFDPERPFTSNDLHFLRSLRNSVEGEEENAAEPDAE
jgi:hypothetical protein